MLDPSQSRTMVLGQRNSTAQWQNKVLNHSLSYWFIYNISLWLNLGGWVSSMWNYLPCVGL